jgi:hypothetical protein
MRIRIESWSGRPRRVASNGARTRLLLYSQEPILAKGLEAVLREAEAIELLPVCETIASLVARAAAESPDIVLLDWTSEIDFDLLGKLKDWRVILWVDSIFAEFARHLPEFGVRGILRKDLPVEVQVKCLQDVQAGKLWLKNLNAGACEEIVDRGSGRTPARSVMTPEAEMSSAGRRCPSNVDDIAEAYWMRLLPPGEMLAFEAHSAHCPSCGRVSSQAHHFVRDFRHVATTPKYSSPRAISIARASGVPGRSLDAVRKSTARGFPEGRAVMLLRLLEELRQVNAAISDLEDGGAPVSTATGRLLVMPARPSAPGSLDSPATPVGFCDMVPLGGAGRRSRPGVARKYGRT